MFTGPAAIGNSSLVQNGPGVMTLGSGTGAKLTVNGTISAAAGVSAAGDLTSAGVNATGNVTIGGTLTAPGISMQSGNVAASNAVTSAVVSASLHMAAPQYKIGSERVLAAPGTANTFVGIGAGRNSVSSGNTLAGNDAGANTVGANNSMFGASAGFNNFSGAENALFGANAGKAIATGGNNSYFGAGAGQSASGAGNSFVGHNAGKAVTTGDQNTLLGSETALAAGIHNATAIGSRAMATHSNTIVLGPVDGLNGGQPVFVGVATDAPRARLDVASGDIFVSSPGRGVIMRTTTGQNCAKLTVNDSGQVSATIISCPAFPPAL